MVKELAIMSFGERDLFRLVRRKQPPMRVCTVRSPKIRIAGAVLAAIGALATQAAAQSGAPLTGAEIRAAFAGRTMEYRSYRRAIGDLNRPSGFERRPDGGYLVVATEFRDDGSAVVRCRNFDARGNSGPPCRFGAGGGDVGVWSVADNSLCLVWTIIRGGENACFAITREGKAYRFRQVSGVPSSVDGELVEVR